MDRGKRIDRRLKPSETQRMHTYTSRSSRLSLVRTSPELSLPPYSTAVPFDNSMTTGFATLFCRNPSRRQHHLLEYTMIDSTSCHIVDLNYCSLARSPTLNRHMSASANCEKKNLAVCSARISYVSHKKDVYATKLNIDSSLDPCICLMVTLSCHHCPQRFPPCRHRSLIVLHCNACTKYI